MRKYAKLDGTTWKKQPESLKTDIIIKTTVSLNLLWFLIILLLWLFLLIESIEVYLLNSDYVLQLLPIALLVIVWVEL